MARKLTKKKMKELGRKGGNTTLNKYGTTYFSKIGKKGGRPKRDAGSTQRHD